MNSLLEENRGEYCIYLGNHPLYYTHILWELNARRFRFFPLRPKITS